MKKYKHEGELFKAALLAGVQYAEGRGAVEFEATDSASDKALYVYRLLVHDKIIAPMPEEQVAEKTIRHRLATWYTHQLPKGDPPLDWRAGNSKAEPLLGFFLEKSLLVLHGQGHCILRRHFLGLVLIRIVHCVHD